MSTRVVSEKEFNESAAKVFLNASGRARTTVRLEDFENLQNRFSGLPGIDKRLVFYSTCGETGIEVHGVGKNDTEVYVVDTLHKELHHLLGIVGRDIDRSRMGCT